MSEVMGQSGLISGNTMDAAHTCSDPLDGISAANSRSSDCVHALE